MALAATYNAETASQLSWNDAVHNRRIHESNGKSEQRLKVVVREVLLVSNGSEQEHDLLSRRLNHHAQHP